MSLAAAVPATPDAGSPRAWPRLLLSVVITTVGGVGLWSVVVVLPTVEDAFGVARAGATLPYTLLMVGFAAGGILMGRLADRHGIRLPLVIGAFSLCAGYVLAGLSQTLWQFVIVHGLLIGCLGSSATFGPMIAEVSRWFVRRRGLAVSIAACGSYFAGAVWPPVIQLLVEALGWRMAHVAIGVGTLAILLPLTLLVGRPAPRPSPAPAAARAPAEARPDLPVSPRTLQVPLVVMGITCCIAMAMPQVHVVALCTQLGYGPVVGVQMLSLMLATGIVSRLLFGILADRIGPLPTLVTSSALQAFSLLLFLPFDGLAPLYLVSALFGLAQGGIVPTYAMVVRAFFPASEAASRIGIVFSATLVGMAIGGWLSGLIFDMTMSYGPAFVNGFAWNLLNVAIALFLLARLGSGRVPPARQVSLTA